MTNPEPRNEPVGYKAPPKATQFQKGRSGNPRGRPRGSKNNKTVFENLAATLIDGKLPGGGEKITIREGVIAKLVSQALAGDSRSLNKFIDTMQSYDDENKAYCQQAELEAIHRILQYHHEAQIRAGDKFNTAEIKTIAAYLRQVDVEFKKFEPQINALFDKNNFARPEILDENDDSSESGEDAKLAAAP